MQAVQFYKAWDAYGALSNFSCHPIRLPEGPLTDASTAQNAERAHDWREWQSVEHYYQAQKFATTSGKQRSSLPSVACLLLLASLHSPESLTVLADT